MLVIFEGLDGSGKSTLIKAVEESSSVLITKEPGSPYVPCNKAIRELVLFNAELTPLQRELLFYADALGHRNFLKQQEGVVLSDRGLWSHLAYLYGYMKLAMLGEDPEENYIRYSLCKKLIAQTCQKPDAVIYIEGSLEVMRQRLSREKDAIEKLPSAFFAYVLVAYDDLLMAAEIESLPVLELPATNSVSENCRKACEFIENLQKSQS